MDEQTKGLLRDSYRQQLEEDEAELARLISSSEEFGRSRFGQWEDLKPAEIDRLKRQIADYHALMHELN